MFEKDITLQGKHATYADFLYNGNKKSAAVFDTLYDVYITAAIIGVSKGLMVKEDRESKESKRIFADKVIKEQTNLTFAYRLVMMIDKTKNLSNDEKIFRAFQDDNNEEHMKLFNSYVRGGIEWLYDEFTMGSTTKDEYLQKICEIVMEHRETLC